MPHLAQSWPNDGNTDQMDEVTDAIQEEVAAFLNEDRWPLKAKNIPVEVTIYDADLSRVGAASTVIIYAHPTELRSQKMADGALDELAKKVMGRCPILNALIRDEEKGIQFLFQPIAEDAWGIA